MQGPAKCESRAIHVMFSFFVPRRRAGTLPCTSQILVSYSAFGRHGCCAPPLRGVRVCPGKKSVIITGSVYGSASRRGTFIPCPQVVSEFHRVNPPFSRAAPSSDPDHLCPSRPAHSGFGSQHVQLLQHILPSLGLLSVCTYTGRS